MDQVLIAIVLLISIYMLGSSRLGGLVNAVAWQGLFLCLLAASVQKTNMPWHEWVLILLAIVVKALILPLLLKRALRETLVQREVEPQLGYSLSLFIGLLLLVGSIWTVWKLPLPPEIGNPMAVAIALFTLMVGLLLIVARTKAITQTIGYLTMENGIYVLGLTLAVGSPVVIEMGILLDVFVGVLVMGIMIFNINREFDHINTRHFTALKD
ncbi:MAG: hypothetical protein B6241_02000 [Spirochaetaceae bacterium 4572_59]|nr:MAG: hypothetical protein B6241_02000 [Spirochaetaceae bacterium 4572_59]